MWEQLNEILDFLYTCWDQMLVLYFSGGILSACFAIYIIRKLSTLIDRLR